MGQPGFEPESRAPEALAAFETFCIVDLQLKESTSHRHRKRIENFLNKIDKLTKSITKEDLRNYLLTVKKTESAWSYKNKLSALKRFFRDYLGRKNIVEGFKFPRFPLMLKNVPSKEELVTFYNALESDRDRALFLLYASTGLRASELLSLKKDDIDLKNRMIAPKTEPNETKHTWISFYNKEAEIVLKNYLTNHIGSKLFDMGREAVNKMFIRTKKKSGVRITPKMLREWFCCEMGRLGVPDRYIDAFCGRVPRSILARHYTDYSPKRLKEIYDRAGLRVLG